MRKKVSKIKRKLHSMRHAWFDKFIFIHINKTGGSSIEKALNIPFEHRTALEKIREIGRSRWDRKWTFAFVRNPWDKVVSHYYHRVKTNQTGLGDQHIDFKEWVKRAYGNKDAAYYDKPKMFMPQTDWIADEDGQIIVDDILRFENLEADFRKVLEKLERSASLRHAKKSDRGNYGQYHDAEAAELVRSWFARDIERFGYQFEDGDV